MIVSVVVTASAAVIPWVIVVAAITIALAICAYIMEASSWGYSGNGWKEGALIVSAVLALIGAITTIWLAMIVWTEQDTDLFHEAQRAVLTSQGYTDIARESYGDWIAVNSEGDLVEIDFRGLAEENTFLLTESPVGTED